MATIVRDTLCATLSGLSKIYRACGYRVGWAVFSGRVHAASEYLSALELLSSLRLCSNVPAQWAVQTALGGHQSIRELVSPGGRLYESRKTILNAVQNSRFLKLQPPAGAMYGFIGVDTRDLPEFDDQQFALDLLEQKHVLVAPGVSFNVPYRAIATWSRRAHASSNSFLPARFAPATLRRSRLRDWQESCAQRMKNLF